jgi:hypothetical protein
MLSYINLSDNYLEIDLNTETVLRVRLDGDITTTVSEDKIEYVGTGIRITVNTTEQTFEIHTDTIIFNVSYVDFPEMPEMLAGLIEEYMKRGDEECDYCHGPVGRCGGSCRDSDLY